MSTYKTQGIIIKRSHFGEANLLLDIYTKEYGKIQATARSARKAKGKLKGHLELFFLTNLILAHGKSFDIITNSTVKETFLNFRDNLKISLGAYYVLEIVNKMTIQSHKGKRVFELLQKELYFLDCLAEKVNKSECDIAEVVKKYYLSFLLFQVNVLSLSGFYPEMNKCVLCSEKISSEKNYFSFKLGGILDQKCKSRDVNSIEVSDNTIKLIRLFSLKKIDKNDYRIFLDENFEKLGRIKIDDKLIQKTVEIMNRFIEYNLDRRIEGFRFLI